MNVGQRKHLASLVRKMNWLVDEVQVDWKAAKEIADPDRDQLGDITSLAMAHGHIVGAIAYLEEIEGVIEEVEEIRRVSE